MGAGLSCTEHLRQPKISRSIICPTDTTVQLSPLYDCHLCTIVISVQLSPLFNCHHCTTVTSVLCCVVRRNRNLFPKSHFSFLNLMKSQIERKLMELQVILWTVMKICLIFLGPVDRHNQEGRRQMPPLQGMLLCCVVQR